MSWLLVASAMSSSADGMLFIHQSEDPFLDTYIETITHMNTKDLLAIPKMNDSDFQYYLTHEGDSHFGTYSIVCFSLAAIQRVDLIDE